MRDVRDVRDVGDVRNGNEVGAAADLILTSLQRRGHLECDHVFYLPLSGCRSQLKYKSRLDYHIRTIFCGDTGR